MDDAFIDAAEAKLVKLLHKLRPELLKAHGNVEFEDKADNQGPVTELDNMVEREIKQVLKGLDPTIGFAAEEYGLEGSVEKYWTIDPIDGTNSYIRGFPNCFNMVALVKHGKVLFALVYQFVEDKLYTARDGKGAFLNGKPINVSDRPIHQAWIYSHASPGKYTKSFINLTNSVASIVTAGNVFHVAEGKLDGYVSTPDGSKGGIWDYAPRALILKEAGAKISNINSDTYNPAILSLIATNPIIFDDVHSIISAKN